MSEKAPYRTFVFHENLPDGKIITLPEKIDLEKWFIDNPGWVHNQCDLPRALSALAEDPIKITKPTAPKDEKIPVAIRDKIELLLSGQKVDGKVGFSLNSFCHLYGISPSYISKKEAKRPIFDAILEAYKAKKKLWKHQTGRWFFWGVNPYKKKKKGKK